MPRPTAIPDHAPAPSTSDAEDDTDTSVGWLLPGLAGAGALLAGSLLITVCAHRRTQLRYRRPGLALAPPPSQVRDIEKTVTATGGPAAEWVGDDDELASGFRHYWCQLGDVFGGGRSHGLVSLRRFGEKRRRTGYTRWAVLGELVDERSGLVGESSPPSDGAVAGHRDGRVGVEGEVDDRGAGGGLLGREAGGG